MQEGRSYFTPCNFHWQIYLPCPNTTPVIEAFSSETLLFRVLPVGLPGLLEFGRSVSFVADGEVIVLTECRQMAGWRVDTETEFRVSATDRECWQCH